MDIVNWISGRQSLIYQLQPDQFMWFLLEWGHTVEQWARLCRNFNDDPFRSTTRLEKDAIISGVRFLIEVTDQFIQSFKDKLIVDVLALPMKAIIGTTDSWAPAGFAWTRFEDIARVRVVGAQRHYY